MNKLRSVSKFFNFSASANFKFLPLVFLTIFLNAFSQIVTAQEKPPEDLVPPPLIIVSKGEGEQLNAETDARKRTDLALELIEARMVKAEKFSVEKEFTESLNEIGGFQGIVLNSIKYLERNQTGSRNLKGFKTLEISLRSYAPRLELLRREMPPKYGYHIRAVIKFIRDARTRATDKLFDKNFSPDRK